MFEIIKTDNLFIFNLMFFYGAILYLKFKFSICKFLFVQDSFVNRKFQKPVYYYSLIFVGGWKGCNQYFKGIWWIIIKLSRFVCQKEQNYILIVSTFDFFVAQPWFCCIPFLFIYYSCYCCILRLLSLYVKKRSDFLTKSFTRVRPRKICNNHLLVSICICIFITIYFEAKVNKIQGWNFKIKYILLRLFFFFCQVTIPDSHVVFIFW